MPLRIVAILLALAVASGCALGPKFQKPHLQVVDVHLVRGDLLRQELRVRMLVQNPNDRELVVRAIDYAVELAGEPFARGQSGREFTVPANGQLEFDLDATANAVATALRLFADGRRLDALDYRVTGNVTLASGLRRSLPFSHKGEIRLR